MLLQAHIQEHVSLFARDIVGEVFKQAIEKSQMAGEPVPQITARDVRSCGSTADRRYIGSTCHRCWSQWSLIHWLRFARKS